MTDVYDDTNVLTVTSGPSRTLTVTRGRAASFTVASRETLPDVYLDTEAGFRLITEAFEPMMTSDSVTNFTVRGRIGRIVAPFLSTEDYLTLITEAGAGLLAA